MHRMNIFKLQSRVTYSLKIYLKLNCKKQTDNK